MQGANSVLNEIRRQHEDRENGTLTLSKCGEHIEVYYRDGIIDAVSSNLDSYRLGHYLVKQGWLQSGDLAQLAAESQRYNMLFGEAALWRKFLDSADLAEVVRRQVLDLLKHAVTDEFSVDRFTAGVRSFYVSAKVDFAQLLLELSRSDPAPFEPDPAQLIVLSNNSDLAQFPWHPQELSVLGELTHPRTFPDLLASVRMSESRLKAILGIFDSLGLLELSSVCLPELEEGPTPSDNAIIKRSSLPFEQLVPLVTNAVSSEKLEIRQNASSFISEQFKNLKVGIGQAHSETPIKVLAVSSPANQEGKSLVSANLAFAFSMDPGRRVIVVDCDLRNPSLDKYLGVPLKPGLLGYLTNSHLGPHCFMRRLENLFFLTTGGTAANPIELLSLDKMKALISYLKTEFHTIILDAPPFSPIADARIISALSDAMILVVRRGKTSYNSMERAFKLVDSGKLLGVVLNDVKASLFNSHYRYDYYQYSQDNRYLHSRYHKARSAPRNYLEP